MRAPIQGLSYLPGQLELAQCGPNQQQQLQRRADAPLLPTKAQAPCDHGLFSDQHKQEELFR